MILHDYLSNIASNSESYFQAHLAKEDLARIDRLWGMAQEAQDSETLQKDALYIGWTPGDLRTGEIKQVLLPLIAAIFDVAKGEGGGDAVLDAWKAFHEERIKVLIHCL